jgi:transposase-like protein
MVKRVVCPTCRINMKCVKNGHTVRYGGRHCFSGDKYKCPECENESVIVESDRFEYEGNIQNCTEVIE